MIEQLWPSWVGQARGSRSLKALRCTEDDLREIATRVAEKVMKSGGGLRLYPLWRERYSDKGFGDWIRIVTSNVIRDYVRERIGSVQLGDGEISPKRFLNELATSGALGTASTRPPFTAKETARKVLEFAAQRLPRNQATALGLWLEGSTYPEMAETIGCDADGARDLTRAAIAVLRRTFGRQSNVEMESE